MRTDDLYSFMRARELIRLRKENGTPWPWTDDPILREYKFTNVKREHDRTTRQLNDEFYSQHRSAPLRTQLFNCAMFRYFGTIEFARAVGWQRTFAPTDIKHVARQRLRAGERVFTGAYMITNCGQTGPKVDIVVNQFLSGVWDYSDALVRIMRRSRSWQNTIECLMNVRGFGGSGFMAKEVILDTMFTSIWDGKLPIDYNTWCPAGPGARRGINRLLGRPKKQRLDPKFALSVMRSVHAEQDEHWPDSWPELSLHDVQFQLCEFDKYERTRLGEGRPRSRYRRGD